MGLSLLALVNCAEAQTTNLSIAAAGKSSLLYWPASTTNSIVQMAGSPTSTNWITVSNAFPVSAVIVTNSGPVGYYRLFSKATNALPPAGMVLIPAGSFILGNCVYFGTVTNEADILSASPTNTTVSAFYMDANLITLSQWQGVTVYAKSRGYSFENAGSGKAMNHPVQTVNWFDCIKFCNARSEQDGLTPVYYVDATFVQVFKTGVYPTAALYVNWSANGYRLPTEAEWEKAARGGLTGNRFPWGNVIAQTLANYDSGTGAYASVYDLGPSGYNAIGAMGGTSPATSPVGSFPPNGYGLYDMAGNVRQWCWDWYNSTPYAGGTDPHGPSGWWTYRIMRGGSWYDYGASLRCSVRPSDYPFSAYNYIGFRCVKNY